MLNKQQETALTNLLSDDSNVALLGSAGVGKSTVIRSYLKQRKAKVLASTGVAAVLLGDEIKASTFHSFFGLGTMQENLETVISNAVNNELVRFRIKNVKEIVIDEISLLSGKVFDVASYIARLIREDESDKPFGGIRIIVVGDFHQLAPVSRESKITDWVFDSYTWNELNFKVFELTEVMRTKDLDFLKILHKARKGIVDQEVSSFLNKHLLKKNEQFTGTRLYSHKAKVLEYNQSELAKLTTPLHSFPIDFEGEEKDVLKLKRNLPIEDPVILKIGAFVMTRVNFKDLEQGIEYVNGTTGFIVDITPNWIMIETLDKKRIPIFKTTFKLTNPDGDIIAKATCIPLSHAWAITIHKSQGCTLDSALIDLSRGGKWASGLGYTALSRLTSSQNLKILAWNKASFYLDPRVVQFYNRIKRND